MNQAGHEWHIGDVMNVPVRGGLRGAHEPDTRRRPYVRPLPDYVPLRPALRSSAAIGD